MTGKADSAGKVYNFYYSEAKVVRFTGYLVF